MTNNPEMGVVMLTWPTVYSRWIRLQPQNISFGAPIISLKWVKLGISNLVFRLTVASNSGKRTWPV